MALPWLALALAMGAAPAAGQHAGDDVLARVEGEPVTRAELDRTAANPLVRADASRQLGVERPGEREVRRVALRHVIHRRLLVQEARRRGVTVSEAELDGAIAALRRRFDDLRAFGAWMRGQGLDDAGLFAAVRDDLAMDRVRAALVADVAVERRRAVLAAWLAEREAAARIELLEPEEGSADRAAPADGAAPARRR